MASCEELSKELCTSCAGSYNPSPFNHLRAFASTLYTKTGETYEPKYLDAAAYQAITGAGNGMGGAGRGGGGYRGGRP